MAYSISVYIVQNIWTKVLPNVIKMTKCLTHPIPIQRKQKALRNFDQATVPINVTLMEFMTVDTVSSKYRKPWRPSDGRETNGFSCELN